MVSVPDSAGQIQPLLEALASLVSTAVERLHFVEVAHGAQLEAMSERLRNSILSALSHDVRTPLTALYGMADSLAMSRASLPAEAADTALAIRDQALRVSDMVGKLLDMARLRSGACQPAAGVGSPPRRWLAPASSCWGRALAGHPIAITGLDVLPLLEFDAVLIERVLCNLFENAAKYSPPGSPITLEALARPAEVELRVCNAGEGFPPDRLDRVFDAFERGRPEGRVGGMGLGAGDLPGDRRGPRRHDPRIQPSLRRCLRGLHAAAGLPAGHRGRNLAPGRRAAMSGAMILIVEDDSQIRRFVRAALEHDGLRVAEAQGRREGLIEAGRCRPDLVILDLGLPDGDGADFVADFRAWSSAPVLVLSARSTEHDKIGVLDAGADDYLTKPFSVGELLAPGCAPCCGGGGTIRKPRPRWCALATWRWIFRAGRSPATVCGSS